MSVLQEVQEMDKMQGGVATPEQAPENESGRSSASLYFADKSTPDTKDELDDFEVAGILPCSNEPVFIARKGTKHRKARGILKAKRLMGEKDELWPSVVACEVCRFGGEFKKIDIYDLENLEDKDWIAIAALMHQELGEGLKAYAPKT
ncbi:MAG: hypothetical protein AAGA60_22875 [Cyanobacteria bacterium P01_E01_bin.42]